MGWQDYSKASDEDLVEYIKWKDQPDYQTTAEEAFEAFTFRYCDDVAKKARVIATNWGYDVDIGDLVAERAFAKFWKYPKGFDPKECKRPTLNECIIFYLFRIAQRCLCDYYNNEHEPPNPYNGSEEVVVEFPELEVLDLPVERLGELKKSHTLMKGALDRLKPKHRIIYLTYRAYEKEGYKLPRPLLKALREELDLTQTSIRVYKKNAIEEVENYLKLYGNK